MVQYNSKNPGAGSGSTSKESYCLGEGKARGDGGAEGSSAIGDRGQASISLTPDIDRTDSGSLLKPDAYFIFAGSQFEGPDVGDLLYNI